MICELHKPLDIECLVKTAVELWEDPHNLFGLSERQKQVLDRARRDVEDEDEGRRPRPALTAVVPLAELDTAWVVRRSDSHTDGEITLWSDEDSAYRYLADHVRGCWDNVRDLAEVPQDAPTDDREAVEAYYGAGRANDSYTVYSETIGRPSPVPLTAENDRGADGADPHFGMPGTDDT